MINVSTSSTLAVIELVEMNFPELNDIASWGRTIKRRIFFEKHQICRDISCNVFIILNHPGLRPPLKRGNGLQELIHSNSPL